MAEALPKNVENSQNRISISATISLHNASSYHLALSICSHSFFCGFLLGSVENLSSFKNSKSWIESVQVKTWPTLCGCGCIAPNRLISSATCVGAPAIHRRSDPRHERHGWSRDHMAKKDQPGSWFDSLICLLMSCLYFHGLTPRSGNMLEPTLKEEGQKHSKIMKVQLQLRFNCYGSILCEILNCLRWNHDSDLWIFGHLQNKWRRLSVVYLSNKPSAAQNVSTAMHWKPQSLVMKLLLHCIGRKVITTTISKGYVSYKTATGLMFFRACMRSTITFSLSTWTGTKRYSTTVQIKPWCDPATLQPTKV